MARLVGAIAVAGVALAVARRTTREDRRVWLHSVLVSLANPGVTVYLAAWGVLGYRSWS